MVPMHFGAGYKEPPHRLWTVLEMVVISVFQLHVIHNVWKRLNAINQLKDFMKLDDKIK